jgi:hypothetical protein
MSWGKQMEGDNSQRRKTAGAAQKAGRSASEYGVTTGGSKQQSRSRGRDAHVDRLAETQRGEAKQAGPDVPRPVRGKGRRRDPLAPPRP